MSNAACERAELRAALAAAEARVEAAESELEQARATVTCSEAMTQELKLEVASIFFVCDIETQRSFVTLNSLNTVNDSFRNG